ncbi:hypothetical protein CU097_002915 [Rhizopus azygosporus]|uniref:Uncharacterized protein n=1 Tax=Rhizopus azygosporus TaxID=86630 RepID=A0A367IPS4_RHIAZ|nr:hypothetical protein CU097_002915 [Rhizopus azygosporus]
MGKETITQLVEFLNLVYLLYDPGSKMYEEKSITINNILSKCSTRNIKFLAQQSKRKKNDLDVKVSVRSLYIMKDKRIIEVLNYIVDYLPKYQEYIQQLKDQGYTMVGCCRKSKQTHETATIDNVYYNNR